MHAIGAGWSCFWHFFSLYFPSLWDVARYSQRSVNSKTINKNWIWLIQVYFCVLQIHNTCCDKLTKLSIFSPNLFPSLFLYIRKYLTETDKNLVLFIYVLYSILDVHFHVCSVGNRFSIFLWWLTTHLYVSVFACNKLFYYAAGYWDITLKTIPEQHPR